ncbi:hypothetical protein [Streptomyces boninensis]|uniref:hypothetical protein n=1 Tax=Streptomyces boninensis TaxID=2039455 RepID=UPI003B212CE6
MRRHEFEPAKLLAGLVLITAAILYVSSAEGGLSLPYWWLLPLCVVMGLGLAGLVAAISYATGRTRRRAADAAAARDLGPGPEALPGMPMDTLRGAYEHLGEDAPPRGGERPRDS